MQKRYYEAEAARWTPENRDPVVGTFDAHNAWEDYEILFRGIKTAEMDALDFGCGPGRAIKLWRGRFNSLDGMDISKTNIEKATQYLEGPEAHKTMLFVNNGIDCRPVADNTYDLVYSVICLQHIPVFEIRVSIIRDIYRILKPGGVFTFQMGYGGKEGHEWQEWFSNKWDAPRTNGQCDVSITDTLEVSATLHEIGFKTVGFSDLRPTGPGDAHKNWIFIKAWK
jgi:SAM-dependent methyltransferase